MGLFSHKWVFFSAAAAGRSSSKTYGIVRQFDRVTWKEMGPLPPIHYPGRGKVMVTSNAGFDTVIWSLVAS